MTETRKQPETTDAVGDNRLAYKLSEAASMLGVSSSTLRKMVRRGDLNVVTAFGPWIITRQELDRLLTITLRPSE